MKTTHRPPETANELVRIFIDNQEGCPNAVRLKIDRHLAKKGLELALVGLQKCMLEMGMVSKA